MGFKPKAKHYRLKFVGDDEYDGLEVVCTSLSVGDFEELMDIVSTATRSMKNGTATTDSDETRNSATALIDRFASCLVSWNVEDENSEPIPATRSGVSTQQFDFVLVLINRWMEAIAGVDPNLQKNSNNGEISLGLQETMEVQ